MMRFPVVSCWTILGFLLGGASLASAAPESAWTALPINGGGFIQSVEIAPSDPNVWYSYVDVGGPYRSDNAGRTWRPLHGNMPQTLRNCFADHLRALSVDPRDADRIVFASGRLVWQKPAGVYVSRDGGRTYSRTLKADFHGEGPFRFSGRVLRRDPANPDRMLAASDSDGVFLSRDGGDSWVSCGVDGHWFVEVWFDLAVPGRAYACAPVWPSPENDGKTYGLFRSEDGGVTWKKVADDAPFEMTQVAGRKELLGIFRAEGGNELRRSRDGGASWSPFAEGLPDKTRYQAVAAGPDFYLTTDWDGQLYRRAASDLAWREVPTERLEMSHPEKENGIAGRDGRLTKPRCCTSRIIVDPKNPDHILTTDWFQIWQTFDGGRTWRTAADGIHPLVPFTIACDPNSPDNISYGCADMGMFNSQDGGRSYRKEHSICGANSIAFCFRAKHRAYAVGGKVGIQLIITADGGRTWRYSAGRGLPALGQKDGQHGIYTVAVDPATDWPYLCVSGRVAPGAGGIYRSKDGGDTWEWFARGMDGDERSYKASEFEFGGAALWPDQLVFGPDGSALTYLPYTGKMYCLDSKAGEWKKLPCFNKGGCFTIAADPFAPGRFLMACKDFVMEFTDGGRKVNWQLAGSKGLGYAIAFDPFTRGLVVASSSDAQDVCVSTDGGRHWTCLLQGMDVPTGTQHKLVVDRLRLFLLTRGSGVWTRTLKRGAGGAIR